MWNTYSQQDDKRFRHRSINGSISFVLIPTSKHITPYVGVGYQGGILGRTSAWINLSSEDEDNPTTPGPNEYEGITELQTGYMKAGLLITPFKKMTISAEYTRSIGLEADRAFHQFNLTISRHFAFNPDY